MGLINGVPLLYVFLLGYSLEGLDAKSTSFNNHKSSSVASLMYTYEHDYSDFGALIFLNELQALIRSLTLHITQTPKFLNLNPSTGLCPASNYGEDVMVGVIDSGVCPESESFKGAGMPTKVPKK